MILRCHLQLFDQVEFVARQSGRKLQQRGGGGGGGGGGGNGSTGGGTPSEFRASNTLRSGIATADSIQRATNSGARLRETANAAGVGSTTVFANAQGNQQVSSQGCATLMVQGGTSAGPAYSQYKIRQEIRRRPPFESHFHHHHDHAAHGVSLQCIGCGVGLYDHLLR